MEIIFLTSNPKLLQNDNLLDQAQGEPLAATKHLLMQFTEKYFFTHIWMHLSGIPYASHTSHHNH